MIIFVHNSAVNCGSLSSPVNGQVVVPITTLGNTAVYSCNNGFALVGDETRECQVGGDWSGSQPTCVGKYLLSRL